MTTSCYTELSAVGTRTNGNGFKVEGREGWLNLSKFASLAMPEVGQRVRVGLDRSGYVRDIQPEPSLTAAPAAPAAPESPPARGIAP